MTDLIKQKTSAPTRKVAAGGIGGAVVGLLSWLLLQYGVELEPGVAEALTVVLTWAGGFAASYMTRERA